MTERADKGMAIRRKVLGETHVDRAEEARGPFDDAFQQMITEGAWGHVWARETLPLRERSMLTLALLAAQGMDEEFAMHLRATANTGATAEDVQEVLLHVAVYAGVPRANAAIKIAKQIYAEMGGEL